MIWLNKKSLAISVLAPFLAYFAVFSQGWLRESEYNLYDSYLTSRTTESIDDRVVIVGITEEDLQRLNQSALDDGTLVKVLRKIKTHNPRVIGLDLHRNLPVCFKVEACESDSKELASIFRDTPNLIGIEKTDKGNPQEPIILPHPELVGRTGDSSIIEDKDRRVRRSFFYVTDTDKKNTYSFGVKVALSYIPKDLSHFMAEKKWFKLGNAIVPGIEGTEKVISGVLKEPINKLKELGKIYSADEISNYQILLNYRQNKQPFKQLSISQLLDDDFSSQELKDKIVLIGAVYELSGDTFYSPYLNSQNNLIYGVELHAQLVSYLVNAALEERTVLKFAPRFVELILIGFLLLEPCLFILLSDKKQQEELKLLILFIVQLSLIVGGGWFSLSLGYWLPEASLISITFINLVLLGAFIYHNNQEEAKLKLEEQVNQKTEDLQKALADLKKITREMIKEEKLDFLLESTAFLDHEIKNPLGLILVSSEAVTSQIYSLIEYFEKDDIHEHLQDVKEITASVITDNKHIREQAHRINSLVKLIDTQSYQREEEISRQNIDDLISKVWAVAWHTFNKLINSELKVEIIHEKSKSNRLEAINIYPKSLEVALSNIFANALYSLLHKKKSAQSFQPRIKIKTQQGLDYWTITIEDNGIGIDDKDREKIFQEFYSTKDNSLGFGLPIAKQIVELQHQGKIELKSKLGAFARFTIKIPANINNC